MTPHYYTYPTVLPQHAGPNFFKEQLAHLEIAVSQFITLTPKSQPRYIVPFEDTVPGKVLAFMKTQKDFIAYRELGVRMGISRKSASTAVQALKRQGHFFEERKKGQLIAVRLK